MCNGMTQAVVYGIVEGAFLILATMGFAIVRRINSLLNIAPAEYMAIAAFTTWGLSALAGVPVLASAAIALVVVTIVGYLVGRLIYEPLLGRGAETLLIVSAGVAFAIDGAVKGIVSPSIKSFPLGSPTT